MPSRRLSCDSIASAIFSKSRSRAVDRVQRQDRRLRCASGFQLVVDRFELGHVASVQDHRRAVLRKGQRRHAADPLAGSGHQDYAVFQQIRSWLVALEIDHWSGCQESRSMRAQATPLRTADSSVAGYSLAV